MEFEQKLSSVLSEFARTLLTDFPIQAILDHLVLRIVDVLPVSAAGVTLISPGADPHFIAASDDSALCFERLQSELNEGPCRTAYASGDPVLIPNLQECDAFPRFTSRARQEGLAAVFAFPLHHGDRRLGALDLYRSTPGALDADQITASQTLADVATAYLLNAQGRADLLSSSARDRHESLHDELTGLPNRAFLLERLSQGIRHSRRSGLAFGVLFIDLDLFKEVNDRYGHRTGDELLIAISDRLSPLLRPGDTLGRLSGDEFVIICEDLDDAASVEPVVARISAIFNSPFVLRDAEVRMQASIGVAVSGPTDDHPERLLAAADEAMYEAKRGGGARSSYAAAAIRPVAVDLRDQPSPAVALFPGIRDSAEA
jgi:diguanylate cyclase (GGDEF)-like protein